MAATVYQKHSTLQTRKRTYRVLLTGDALFTDITNMDFSLTEGSDCIDAGIDVGIEFDFIGVEIPQGEAPDIGPYEFKQ